MKPKDILTNYKLKRTSCREGILGVVLDANQALSESEIRALLKEEFDRTTFYRSFKTLVEHKIVHRIVIDNQNVKYAIHTELSQPKEHAHFYCLKCKTVKCLEEVFVPHYELPQGYSHSETEVIIKGTCALCKSGESK